jgi:glycosyltransferase involved in cell wall biosynthesis
VRVHKDYIHDCLKAAIELGVTNQVIFSNELISMKDIGLWCAASDFMISYTQSVGVHSASSVALFGFFLGKPTILADDPRYSSFENGVQGIKIHESQIADAVNMLYENKDLQKQIVAGALEYAKQNSFEEITKMHLRLYERCLKS